MPSQIIPTEKLINLCSKIGSGATPRGGSSVYLEEGEISLIRSQNVLNNEFSDSGLVYIDADAAEKLSNVVVEKDDVLLNITGDSVARCCQVDSKVLPARVNQHVAIIRPEPERLAPKYLRYFLVSAPMQNYMLGLAGAGATRNALTKGMIEGFDIPCPDIETQQNIAHILGTLDDKIELNRQMNETLEAMAQALFKSWFVDFDPVIDNALAARNEIPEPLQKRAAARQALGDQRKPLPAEIQSLFPDSFVFTDEMGWVPEGWVITSFGNVLKCFDSKRIPLSKKQREEKKPGGIPYFGATSIMDYINEWIFDDVYLLVGEDGSVMHEDGTPFIQYIWGKTWVNNHAHVLQGAGGVSTEHLKLFMAQQNIAAYVTGAVQLKINQKNMNSIPFLKAPDALNNYFSHHIMPSYRKIIANSEEIHSLTKLRDTLLPKLLSGELRIADAEKQVAEAV